MSILSLPIDMMCRNPLHLWTGVKDGKFQELPSTPNGVSTQTSQKKKLVEPLPYIGTREASYAKIKATLAALPDNIKVQKQEDNYLYVIFISDGMKFKDDVEFYFDDAKQQIEFRSNSRIGYADMGVNQKRYDAIRKGYCGE